MNKIDLQGRVAIVTGGARGIGLAIARRLTDSGARCCLWDLKPEAPKGLAASTVEVDISKPESVDAAFEQTVKQFGKIDILVNNAGIAGVTKKMWECTPEEWQAVLQVNLFGVFLCCRAVAPHMVQHNYSVLGVMPGRGYDRAFKEASHAALLAHWRAGRLRTPVHRVHPFAQVPDAVAELADGTVQGKVVVAVA